MDSVGSGSDSPGVSPVATNRTAVSSVTELDNSSRHSSRHVAADRPVSSRSSRWAPTTGSSSIGHAAFGDLPRLVLQGIPVLADQDDSIVVVDRHDADREVGEMHDAVDPGVAVGAGHLVVPHGDPRVLVGDAAAVSCRSGRPWRHRRTARAGLSAPRRGGPRLPDVTDPDAANRQRTERTRSRSTGMCGSRHATGSSCRPISGGPSPAPTPRTRPSRPSWR